MDITAGPLSHNIVVRGLCGTGVSSSLVTRESRRNGWPRLARDASVESV
jgi:hypothetical protein